MAEFDNWVVGSETGNGKIAEVFNVRKGEFIIYRLEGSEAIGYNSEENIGKYFSSIGTEWTDVNNLLTSSSHKDRYRGKLAAVMKESLLGKVEGALKKLEKVRQAIINYKTTIGRIEYLIGTFLVAAFACLVLGILIIVPINLPFNVLILKVVIFGIMGGVLSVSINLKSVEIDVYSGTRMIHLILGGTRVIISAVSSIIIYALIKGGILLGVLENSSAYLFYALAAVSGFSESFVPNLLKKTAEDKLNGEEGAT